MSESVSFKVRFTDKAVADLTSIKAYISNHFTQSEVDNMFALIQSFEKVVVAFPELYPKSFKNQAIHRAVLSKLLSVFYQVNGNEIFVVAILEIELANRMATITTFSLPVST